MEPKRLNRRQWAGAVAAAAGSLLRAAPPPVLRLRAYDPGGQPCPPELLETLYVTDRDGRPFAVRPQLAGEGAAVLELPPQRFEIMMILPVRDFGEVYLYADDAGSLYAPAAAEILLNYEFARSRAAFLRRYVKAAEGEGVDFSKELRERIARGEAALAKATAARQERERAGFSNDALRDLMWAGEMAALERARHRIRRRGPRPGFLFGCNAFGYARSVEYAQRYNELLNFATLPFYRASTEKVEGRPDYSWVKAILQKMAGTPILTKGHPLVWFHYAGIPEFLKTKSWEELKKSCREYVLGSVLRFRSRIHVWDVINEAHDWANELNLSHEQLLEMTRLAAETVRLADPTAFRIVNSCCTWSEYVATGRNYRGEMRKPVRSVLEYHRAVEEAKVPYEAIGLQLYNPQRDMLEIERQLERFFIFGKPIHITELGISSANEPVRMGEEVRRPGRRVWHGTEWSERIQADWLEQFYTICYSKPQIEAVSWWDFSDPAFIPHGGLLRPDLTPKEAYHRLKGLIKEWSAA
jgi:GH35 family endo-1,4-beta-xylanase